MLQFSHCHQQSLTIWLYLTVYVWLWMSGLSGWVCACVMSFCMYVRWSRDQKKGLILMISGNEGIEKSYHIFKFFIQFFYVKDSSPKNSKISRKNYFKNLTVLMKFTWFTKLEVFNKMTPSAVSKKKLGLKLYTFNVVQWYSLWSLLWVIGLQLFFC